MPVEHNTTCALIEIVCQYLSRITFCTDNSTGRPSFLPINITILIRTRPVVLLWDNHHPHQPELNARLPRLINSSRSNWTGQRVRLVLYSLVECGLRRPTIEPLSNNYY